MTSQIEAGHVDASRILSLATAKIEKNQRSSYAVKEPRGTKGDLLPKGEALERLPTFTKMRAPQRAGTRDKKLGPRKDLEWKNNMKN